jgi:hypothetical protein
MFYLCTGMYRSGSTWLYNAVRLTLEKAGAPDLAAGVIADKDKILAHRTALIKAHDFDAALAARADVILSSHRDLRDVIASLSRMFHTDFSTAALRQTFNDYVQWAQVADYDLHYERLLTDKLTELKAIAAVLRLPPQILEQLPYEAILEEITAQSMAAQTFKARAFNERPYDPVTLLHDGHITDGRHGSWVNFVPVEIVASIERDFAEWLTAKGYLTPTLS